MEFYTIILVLCFLIGVQCDDQEYKVTNTNSGPVKGLKLLTKYENKDYYSYKGIPYAKPPIGPLRFKAPERIDAWEKPLEAFKFGSNCPQIAHMGEQKYLGEEDCLFLNVYTPANAKNLPVMFYIHGGGYMEGSGDDFLYGPDFLINENVILVTFNYRLGPAGFMSLGTKEYSGNMGLKDQLLALQWVNDNIHEFGGDAKKITIFGHSAGGSSTHLLTLSPQTKGLYQRAIVMSGCAYNPWAVGVKNDHMATMFQIGFEMGENPRDFQSLLSFLKTADIKELVLKSTKGGDTFLKDGRFTQDILFTPVVERAEATTPMFTEDPEDNFMKDFRNDIDMIFGHTTAEALFFIGPLGSQASVLKEFDEKFIVSLPNRHLQQNNVEQAPPHEKARKAIKKYYFGDNEVSKDQLEKLIDLSSDIFFNYGIEKSVEIEAERKGKTYYFIFNGDGRLNALKILFNVAGLGISKASHGDELCYLFRCAIFDETYDKIESDSNERKMIKHISSTFANFAKTGIPKTDNSDVEWKPVTTKEKNVVLMESDRFTNAVNVLDDMTNFWDNTLITYKHEMYGEESERDEL